MRCSALFVFVDPAIPPVRCERQRWPYSQHALHRATNWSGPDHEWSTPDPAGHVYEDGGWPPGVTFTSTGTRGRWYRCGCAAVRLITAPAGCIRRYWVLCAAHRAPRRARPGRTLQPAGR